MKERRVDIAVEDNYMFCGNCGNEIKEGEKFCSSCGTPVPAEEAIKETAKSAEQPADAAVAEPKKKKRKGGLIALILVLAVLATGGGTAAVYFTSDGYKIGKNEKLANECVDAGDYKGALGYYKEILRLDDLREDIYVSAAEAYLELEKTDKALDMLQDGLKACKKDENAVAMLMAKQVEIYQKQINDCLAAGDYNSAFSLIDEAYAATGAAELLAGKTEAYKAESEAYANAGDYASARNILQKGIEETGDETLRAGITTAYLKEADVAIQGADYEGAESVLWEGISATGDGDGNLLAKVADIYRLKSDAALASGDCVYGVQLLISGAEATGSDALRERADYVKQNVIALPEKVWSGSGNGAIISTCEYDDANRLFRKTDEYAIPSDSYWLSYPTTEFVYDDSGRLIASSNTGSVITYEYDEAGNLVKTYMKDSDDYTYVSEYNEAGKRVRQYKIDNYGNDIYYYDYYYEYDASGNLSKITKYRDTWEYDTVYKSEYEYDVNRNLTRYTSQVFDHDGVPDGLMYVITYDYAYDGGRCVKLTKTIIADSDQDGEYDPAQVLTYEFLYDEAGKVSSIVGADDSWQRNYTYDETTSRFSVSDTEDRTGYYQPLEGEMNYTYTSGTSSSTSSISYSMYTYDCFGNKIYSVAGSSAYDSEDVVLSYIYRYVGE